MIETIPRLSKQLANVSLLFTSYQSQHHGTRRKITTEHHPLTAPSCQRHLAQLANPISIGADFPEAHLTRPSWATCPMMFLRSRSKTSSAAWQQVQRTCIVGHLTCCTWWLQLLQHIKWNCHNSLSLDTLQTLQAILNIRSYLYFEIHFFSFLVHILKMQITGQYCHIYSTCNSEFCRF